MSGRVTEMTAFIAKITQYFPEKNITWQRGTLFLPASHTTWNIGLIKYQHLLLHVEDHYGGLDVMGFALG